MIPGETKASRKIFTFLSLIFRILLTFLSERKQNQLLLGKFPLLPHIPRISTGSEPNSVPASAHKVTLTLLVPIPGRSACLELVWLMASEHMEYEGI